MSEKKNALSSVSSNGLSLQKLSQSIRADIEVVKLAVVNNPLALQYAHPNLLHSTEILDLVFRLPSSRGRRDLFKVVLPVNGLILSYAVEELRKDKDIVKLAVQENGLALEYADVVLRQDADVVRAAVKQNCTALRFAENSIFRYEDIIRLAFRGGGGGGASGKPFAMDMLLRRGLLLQFMSEEIRNDPDCVLTAIVQNGFSWLFSGNEEFFHSDLFADTCFQHAECGLDFDFMFRIVQKNGLLLQFMRPEQTPGNKFSITQAAVKQNGLAIQYAPSELRVHPTIVKLAVERNGLALQFVDPPLRHDRGVTCLAIRQNLGAFLHSVHFDGPDVVTAIQSHSPSAKEAMLTIELMVFIVSKNGILLQFGTPALKANPVVVLAAVTNNGLALQYAEESLRSDLTIAVAAVQNDIKALELVGEFILTQVADIVFKTQKFAELPLKLFTRDGNMLQYMDFESVPIKSHRSITLSAVRHKGSALEYAPLSLKQDIEIVLIAVKQWRQNIFCAHPSVLQNIDVVRALNITSSDSEFVLQCLRRNGLMLQHLGGVLGFHADVECVKMAVKENGLALMYADPKCCSVPEIISLAFDSSAQAANDIAKNLEFMENVCAKNGMLLEKLISSPVLTGIPRTKGHQIILAAVRENGLALQFCPSAFLNREIVRAACESNGMALQFAGPTLCGEKDIVVVAIQKCALAVMYASPLLCEHPEIVRAFQFRIATPDNIMLREDEAFFLDMCSKNGMFSAFASEEICRHKEVALTAVSQNGLALEYFPTLNDDEMVVTAAVRQNGLALTYASSNIVFNNERIASLALSHAAIQSDIEGLVKILSKNGMLLSYLPFQESSGSTSFFRRSSPGKHLFAAVRQNGMALQFLTSEFRKDKELVKAAVESSGLALQFADSTLRSDKQIVSMACNQNGFALQYAGLELIADPTLVQTVIAKHPGCLNDIAFLSILLSVCGNTLQYLPIENRDNDTLVVNAVKQNGLALVYASDRLKRAPSLVTVAVEQNAYALRHAADECCFVSSVILSAFNQSLCVQDEAFMTECVQRNGLLLEHVALGLKSRENIVAAAVKQNGMALAYAGNDMKANVSIVLLAVKQNRYALQFADPELLSQSVILDAVFHSGDGSFNQQDYEFIKNLLTHAGSVYKRLPRCYVEMEELALVAVTQNGLVLKDCSDVFRDTKILVLAAVCQNSLAFQYVSSRLRDDRDVILASVTQNAYALMFAPDFVFFDEAIIAAAFPNGNKDKHQLENNAPFISHLVKKNGMLLTYASPMLQDSSSIAMDAVSQNGMALQYASENVRANQAVVHTAVTSSGMALQYAHQTLRSEVPIVFAALRQCTDSVVFMNPSLLFVEVILDAVFKGRGVFSKEVYAWMLSNNGLLLQHTPEDVRSDKQLVLIGVKQNGIALQYVCEVLRNDQDVVLEAVKNKTESVTYGGTSILADTEFGLTCTSNNSRTLRYFPKTSQEAIIKAACQRGAPWMMDYDFVIQAVEVDGSVLDFVSFEMSQNKEIRVAASNALVRTMKKTQLSLSLLKHFDKLWNAVEAVYGKLTQIRAFDECMYKMNQALSEFPTLEGIARNPEKRAEWIDSVMSCHRGIDSCADVFTSYQILDSLEMWSSDSLYCTSSEQVFAELAEVYLFLTEIDTRKNGIATALSNVERVFNLLDKIRSMWLLRAQEFKSMLDNKIIHIPEELMTMHNISLNLDAHVATLFEEQDALRDAQRRLEDARVALKRAARIGSDTAAAEAELTKRKDEYIAAGNSFGEARSLLCRYFLGYHHLPECKLEGKPPAMQEELLRVLNPSLLHCHDLENVVTIVRKVEGGRNKAYEAVLLSDGTTHVMVKEVQAEGTGLKRFERELKILRRVQHQNIVQCLDGFLSTDYTKGYILLQYHTNGDLAKWSPTHFDDPSVAKSVFYGVFQAVAHLHSLGIVHSDLKPENVLISDAGMPVVCDFDASTTDAERKSIITKTLSESVGGGTVGYIAPEVMMGRPFTTRSDLFSLGRVMDELTVGRTYRDAVWEDIIQMLCQMDDTKRGTALEALQHPLFRGITHTPTPTEFRKAVPTYWGEASSTSSTCELSPTDPAYQWIVDSIEKSCVASTLGSGRDQTVRMSYSKLQVARVYRIENHTLWKMYATRREVIREKNSQRTLDFEAERLPIPLPPTGTLDATVNEAYLWHGTKPQVVRLITEGGFDERVCALNGLFGAGVYFAMNSSKSDQYTTPWPESDPINGKYTLVMSRVVLGYAFPTNQGREKERRPPKIGMTEELYDSVIGQTDVVKYREFIVYDRTQAYPEYVVEYNRVK
eukprot:PhF_6_TR31821/c0_g1_i1/m.47017